MFLFEETLHDMVRSSPMCKDILRWKFISLFWDIIELNTPKSYCMHILNKKFRTFGNIIFSQFYVSHGKGFALVLRLTSTTISQDGYTRRSEIKYPCESHVHFISFHEVRALYSCSSIFATLEKLCPLYYWLQLVKII